MMIHRIVAAVVLGVTLAVPAAAQELVPADSAEVAGYLLTEANFARFAEIVNRMDTVAEGDPRVFAGLEWKPEAPLTLDYIGARYESNATMRAELTRGGMTGREFIVVLYVLVEASRTLNREDQEELAALAGPQAANVRLVQHHGDEIGLLFQVLRRVQTEES